MADSSTLSPTIYHSPPRPDRAKALNTIIEDRRESSFEEDQDNPPGGGSATGSAMIVKFKQAMPHANGNGRHGPPSPSARRSSPTRTSLLRWRPQSSYPKYDDLYDATDDEDDECGESCPSLSSRPTSFASSHPSRDSGSSVSSRNKYPPITIPHASTWPMPHKNSPVPPTPPPKIPVSPAALSLLPRTVPALHAPPSLDGSLTSDQLSNSSAPSTPDGSQKNLEGHWGNDRLRFRPDSDLTQTTEISSEPGTPDIEIRVQSPRDWNHVAGNLPQGTANIHNDQPPGSSEPDDCMERERAQTPSSDNGVALPTGALATLRHIAFHQGPEQLSETPGTDGEMSEVDFPYERPKSAYITTPASAISAYSFTELSIPSPGGFFSSLEPGTRRTWCPTSTANPPSSATAENFYNCPWNRPENVVEQIVRQGDDNTTSEGPPTITSLSDGPPTAIRIPSRPATTTPPHDAMSVEDGSGKEASLKEIVYEYDESYENELKQQALANMDRTSVWLAAQSSYLAALRETNPVNEVDSQGTNPVKDQESRPGSSSKNRLGSLPTIPEGEDQSPEQSVPVVKDSTFYRGFQHVVSRSRRRESFLYSGDRFEAIRASRQCLMEKHVELLAGKYELHPPNRPAYTGPFCQAPRNSVECKLLAEQAKFARVEKEQNALRQLRPSMWAIDALKYLNGGRLIPSPAAKRLAGATSPLGSPESAGKRRVRVLDLGGHPSCDWAWHVAVDYRNVKIYTVVTKDQVVNPEVRGPPNHRPVSVPHLWKLPFRDNQFDVISARSLHMLLKSEFPLGEGKDEYDLCLRECYRCLKPGGYLEFFLMDSELAHAGPHGSAASVEFGFNLKTRGYDPTPTKCFLSRLRKAQFVGMKRAWMFLPMGATRAEHQIPRETPIPPDPNNQRPNDLEAVRGPVGSTSDIANLTGLLGGWMWEQWLLKFQMEMGRDRERLLEGMAAVFDEGCQTGAGWRCLNGWAMKPRKTKKQTCQVAIDPADIPPPPS